MAVVLFKAGTGTVRNGIECEMGVFDEFSFLHLLDQGWFKTPEECYPTEAPETDASGAEETPATDEQTIATEDDDATEQLPDSENSEAEASDGDSEEAEGAGDAEEGEVREQAKEAGITHYWNKGIERVKQELSDAGQSEE